MLVLLHEMRDLSHPLLDLPLDIHVGGHELHGNFFSEVLLHELGHVVRQAGV